MLVVTHRRIGGLCDWYILLSLLLVTVPRVDKINRTQKMHGNQILLRTVQFNGGLEQPNANWESPLDSAGSTGSAAGNGGKKYIRLLGQCGVIAQKL